MEILEEIFNFVTYHNAEFGVLATMVKDIIYRKIKRGNHTVAMRIYIVHKHQCENIRRYIIT
jgi:hypothetical protein